MDSTSSFDDRRLANTPIAIVGMAGLFPQARNSGEYWRNIVAGVDCSSEVPPDRWRVADYYDPDPAVPDKVYAKRGGFLPDIDFSPIEFGLPPNLLGVTSSLQTLSLLVARDLLADAGAVGSAWYDPARTGVVLGVVGCVGLMHPLAMRLSTPVLREVVRSCGLTEADAEEISDRFARAFAPWEENSFPGLLANVTAGRIANRLNLGGMNCTVDAACAASLSAVRMAVNELVDGRADMMITGGCDTENSIFTYMCFSKTGALAHSDRVRPFDQSADGTLLGEGIGLLALKRLADAERDHDRIYAVIRGIGASSDGRAKSIYAPRAEGQQLALRRAYDDAGFPISSVELFEAHATGTAVGDRTEIGALVSVLDESTTDRGYAAIGSVKSQIGHTKGAAGAASLMKTALALFHKVVPPTIGIDSPNKAIEGGPLYLNTTARPWIRDPDRPQRRAGVSAMGFGGTNFHVVLQEHGPAPAVALHRRARILCWHAEDTAALAQAVRSGPAATTDGPIPADAPRLALITTDEDRVAELCEVAAGLLEARPDADDWSAPAGIYFRSRALRRPRVGALFAGQGSQYVNMGIELALTDPAVRQAFDEAEFAFAGAGGRLGPAVYPPHAFREQDAGEAEETLRQTRFAQPAIGALAVGQFRALRELGLSCAAYLGHSFGELTALWAAGALTDGDFFRLACARGRAMAPRHPDDEAGAMAALQCSAAHAGPLLAAAPEVTICNFNAPDQVVVGGPTAQVEAVVAAGQEAGIKARRLPVSAAFHTSLVAHAVEDFRAAVAGVDLRAPDGPVHANTAGSSYGPDVAANRDVLVNQLLSPVDFAGGVRAITAESGCNILVEFGPKQVLTQLARRTVAEDVVTVSVDAGPLGDSEVAFHRAVAQLVVLGVPLRVPLSSAAAPALGSGAAGTPAAGTVSLTGAEYVPPARRQAYVDAIQVEYHPDAATPAPLPAHVAPPAPQALPAPQPSTQFTHGDGHMPTEGPDPDDSLWRFADVLSRQTDLHTRYLDGQLKITDELLTALRGPAAAGRPALVGHIATVSAAISGAHSAANNVLARLAQAGLAQAGLGESGLGDGPAAAAPIDVPAAGDGDTEARSVLLSPPIAAAPLLPAVPLPLTGAPPALDSGPAPAGGSMAAPPTTAQAGAASGRPAGESLRVAVVEMVADRTGYTVEMIDPEMDLEADLGVDSIKRVQIAGLLRERYPHLPALGPETLAELRTITQLVGHLATPDPQPAEDAAPVGDEATGAGGNSGPLTIIPRYRLLTVPLAPADQAPNPFPARPTAAVVRLGPGADDARALREHLGGAGWTVDELLLDDEPAAGWLGADWDDAGLEQRLATFFAARPRLDACVVCVAASRDPGRDVRLLADTVLVAKHATTRLRAAGADSRAAFVTLTRIDGSMGGPGTGADASPDPASRVLGGLAGLSRTIAAESPALFARALDIHPGLPAHRLGPHLLAELRDAAVVPAVVGIDAAGNRCTIAAIPQANADGGPDQTAGAQPAVRADDVILVTGGGRGITARCVIALAAAVPAEFVLLGRTDVTHPLPAWSIGAEDADLAREMIADHSLTGAPPHPRAVAAAVAQVRAQREIARTLQAVEAAGARARYVSVDINDPAAVASALEADRDRISVLVHGAGALADGLLAHKRGDDLRRVFGPKLAGLAAVLSAVAGAPLRQVALFCSVAGVFGNSGQSDYAVANEALSRWPVPASHGPRPRVTAIAWGAWDGGMVTADLRALFESRGVPLLDADAAAEAFVAELVDRRDSGSVLLAPPLALHGHHSQPAGTDHVACRDIDPGADDLLRAHRIDTTIVLPAAHAIGWMISVIEAAYPDHRVDTIEGFEVLRGITFDTDGERPHHVRLSARSGDAGELVVGGGGGGG
ncbi:type I polyketide synthase, partial [Frankia sp. AgB32]|uniref:type I polyketide synthase n=1 Tax=Frankia sp. AgB32 TaxID=631119 RepID=UPI00200D7E1F